MHKPCFVDPHVVATPPDLTYHLGGNLVEIDYLAWNCDKSGAVHPVAYEDISNRHENLEKQFRHHFFMKRRIPVIYYRGKEGLAERDLETSYAPTDPGIKPDDDYIDAVRHAYAHLPDLAHINYFILNASPSYTKELAEDLRDAGEALACGDYPEEAEELAEYYRFIGRYLREKAKAMLDELNNTCTASIDATRPITKPPCTRHAAPGKLPPPALVFIQQTTEDAEVLAIPYLVTAKTLLSHMHCEDIWVADEAVVTESGGRRKLDVNIDTLGHYICRSEIGAKPFRTIVVSDYDKDTVDKAIERSIKENECIYIAYIPKYVFLTTARNIAPRISVLITNNDIELTKKFVKDRRFEELIFSRRNNKKSVWEYWNPDDASAQFKDYGAPPFLVKICG